MRLTPKARNREITPASLRRLAVLLERQSKRGLLAPDQTLELDGLISDLGAAAGTNAECLAHCLASLAAGLLEHVGRPLQPIPLPKSSTTH